MPIIQVTKGLQEIKPRFGACKVTVPDPRPHSVQRDAPAVFSSDRQPLLEAVHRAYDTHVGLRVSAGDVLYCLMQQFALWQKDADSERKDEDRKVLIVRRDEFSFQGPNDWAGTFPDFLEMMPEARGSPVLSDDTPRTLVSRAAALMDANSRRYTYEVHTRCGIPFVDVTGTPDDWAKVLAWTRACACPEVRAAADTVERAFVKHDARFWTDVYKRQNRSGGANIDGWILILFPFYVDNGRGRGAPKAGGLGRGALKARDANHFPSSGVSKVPFVWKYLGTRYNMTLHAGMSGVSGTECLQIEYMWEVTSEEWTGK